MHPSTAIDKSKIAAQLRTEVIGHQLRLKDRVSSTNDVAREMAKAGAQEGLTIIAKEQTAGRGRHGSTWFSPPGQGLLFSVLLRPAFTTAKAGLLPIAASVSVAEGIEQYLKITPKVKWPNDLLLEGKKFCGILSEAEIVGDAYTFVIIGIGINVLHLPDSLPEAIRLQATALSEHVNCPIDRTVLLVRVLEALEKWVRSLERERTTPLLRAWRKRCAHIGKRVAVSSLQGMCEGIDRNGGLLVRADGGELIKIFSGECRLSFPETEL